MSWVRLVAMLLMATPATLRSADAPLNKPPVIGTDAQGWVKSILSPPAGSEEVDRAAIQELEAFRQRPEQAAAQEALAWLDRNRSAVTDVRVPRLLDTAGIGLHLTLKDGKGAGPTVLYLHSFRHHASGKLVAYGLSGKNLKRAYWLGDPKKDLLVQDTGRDLLVEVTAKNGKAPDPLATVVALEFDGPPAPVPMLIRPQRDGAVALHAKDARVIGTALRYEPEPNKNTLGYWTDRSDYAQWRFRLDNPGTFEVELLQGCGKGSGGSEVAVHLFPDEKQASPGATFEMVVQDTGHFQNFVARVVGRLKLGPGQYTLIVKPKSKKGVAVMDLRQVTLKPVKE